MNSKNHNLKYLVLLILLLTPFLVGYTISVLEITLANVVVFFSFVVAALMYPAYCRMIDNDVKMGKIRTVEDIQADDLQKTLNDINFNK